MNSDMQASRWVVGLGSWLLAVGNRRLFKHYFLRLVTEGLQALWSLEEPSLMLSVLDMLIIEFRTKIIESTI